jgi:prepilin-type N-terminal cleavage/methylation domain-containing protein
MSKAQKGFTIVETIVSVAIFAIMIFAILFFVTDVFNTTGFQRKIFDNNDSARKLATVFTNEMRASVVSSTGSFPIESAGTQQIIFYTKSATTVNRVRYYLQSGVLYKGITIPTGNPPIYNLAQEISSPVQPAMATAGGDAIFTYYDGDGNALAQPVNVTQIRNIQMALKIYLQGSKNSTNTYTVTTSATVRNLKDNL